MGPRGPGGLPSCLFRLSVLGDLSNSTAHVYEFKNTDSLSLQLVEHLCLAAPVAEFGLTPAFTLRWHSHKAVGGQGWMAPQESVCQTVWPDVCLTYC